MLSVEHFWPVLPLAFLHDNDLLRDVAEISDWHSLSFDQVT